MITLNSVQMKRIFAALFIVACATLCMAQSDSTAFKGHLYNDEYEVYMQIDFLGDGIEVPNHEIFGPLPGYLGKQRNNFFWLITSAEMKGSDKAELSLINDYGSEDLTATLTRTGDSTYVLRQTDGSTLKVPNKGKWQKLPKETEFKLRIKN